jgi:hypothetical protein
MIERRHPMSRTRQQRRRAAVQLEPLEGRRLLAEIAHIELYPRPTSEHPKAEVGTLDLTTSKIVIDDLATLKDHGGKGGVDGAPQFVEPKLLAHYDHAIVTVTDGNEIVTYELFNLKVKNSVTVSTVETDVTYHFASEKVLSVKEAGGKS